MLQHYNRLQYRAFVTFLQNEGKEDLHRQLLETWRTDFISAPARLGDVDIFE